MTEFVLDPVTQVEHPSSPQTETIERISSIIKASGGTLVPRQTRTPQSVETVVVGVSKKINVTGGSTRLTARRTSLGLPGSLVSIKDNTEEVRSNLKETYRKVFSGRWVKSGRINEG